MARDRPGLPGARWLLWRRAHTVHEAVVNGIEALRLTIAEYLEEGRALPHAAFGQHPGLVLGTSVDDGFVKRSSCFTDKEAATALGVSPSRVDQLVKAGALDSVMMDGKSMVTIASVNARKRTQAGVEEIQAGVEEMSLS